ncbi:hypothetical protein ACVFVO_06880 [Advenella kashmirensis]
MHNFSHAWMYPGGLPDRTLQARLFCVVHAEWENQEAVASGMANKLPNSASKVDMARYVCLARSDIRQLLRAVKTCIGQSFHIRASFPVFAV